VCCDVLDAGRPRQLHRPFQRFRSYQRLDGQCVRDPLCLDPRVGQLLEG